MANKDRPLLIREYRPCDCKALADLFYQTVHTVNAGDYTKEQLNAWATRKVDLEQWDQSFQEHYTLIAIQSGYGWPSGRFPSRIRSLRHDCAIQSGYGWPSGRFPSGIRSLRRPCRRAAEDEIIVGFGDIDETGYLDRLYVHKDYQGKGIATAICDRLEQAVQGKIVTHASITARPFFEKRGYRVCKEQQVERQGIFLTNFIMEKESSPASGK